MNYIDGSKFYGNYINNERGGFGVYTDKDGDE